MAGRQHKSQIKIISDWYETIRRSTQDGFFLADIEANILDVNDAFCHMLCYNREELLSMNINAFDVYEMETPRAKRTKIKS